MRKVILYIAMSLDGKIADADGGVDWLEQIPNPEGNNYGYNALLDQVDTTVMGNSTYRQICDFPIPFPYAEKKNYVITRNEKLTQDENATFISSNIPERIAALKEEEGADIWLIGGAEVNTLLHNAGLIDEYMVFVMPVVLGAGVTLFADSPMRAALQLTHSEAYNSGVVMMRFLIKKV